VLIAAPVRTHEEVEWSGVEQPAGGGTDRVAVAVAVSR
jgi:hypothetical protein